MSKAKAKIYDVRIRGEGEKRMLIRAQTKQAAVAAAARKLITCDYADQHVLYEASKANVEMMDATAEAAYPTLTGIEPPPV